jgi:glycosyltransferase involved in cell wall biosynthesis
VVSTRLEVLRAAVRDYLHDPDLARATGLRAREVALGRYSLDRFLTDWDEVLEEVT